ncbi:hypothetical protein Trydic_g18096 [Trypoxylus dichotomus]
MCKIYDPLKPKRGKNEIAGDSPKTKEYRVLAAEMEIKWGEGNACVKNVICLRLWCFCNTNIRTIWSCRRESCERKVLRQDAHPQRSGLFQRKLSNPQEQVFVRVIKHSLITLSIGG